MTHQQLRIIRKIKKKYGCFIVMVDDIMVVWTMADCLQENKVMYAPFVYLDQKTNTSFNIYLSS